MAKKQSNGIERITKLRSVNWRSQIIKAKSEANTPGGVEREKDAFTEEEHVLMRALLFDTMLVNGILLMFGTGIRTQEMLALMEEGIAHDTVQIENALTASITE